MRVEGEVQADLILMASHGRGGLRRWLMGSVTTSVIHHANAPLLVIPAAANVPHIVHGLGVASATVNV